MRLCDRLSGYKIERVCQDALKGLPEGEQALLREALVVYAHLPKVGIASAWEVIVSLAEKYPESSHVRA